MFNDSIENVDKLTELLNIVYAPEGTWNTEGKLKLTSVSISQPIYTTDQCYRYGYSYAYNVKATLDYDGHTMTHIYRIPKELDHGIIYNKEGQVAQFRVMCNSATQKNIIDYMKKYNNIILRKEGNGNTSINLDGLTLFHEGVFYSLSSFPGFDEKKIQQAKFSTELGDNFEEVSEAELDLVLDDIRGYGDADDELQDDIGSDEDENNEDLLGSEETPKEESEEHKTTTRTKVYKFEGKFPFNELTLLRLSMVTNKDYSVLRDGEIFLDIINNKDALSKITMIDLEFMDAYDGLRLAFWRKRFNKRREIKYKLNRYGECKATDVQNIIDCYFRNKNKDQDEATQHTINTNPLTNYSQSKKIYIYRPQNGGRVVQRLAYNQGLFGVICPLKSIESQQINVKNELAINTEFVEGDLQLRLIDFNTMEEKLVTRVDYLKSYTLCSENFDYQNKSILATNGKISVCHMGKILLMDPTFKPEYIHIFNGEFAPAVSQIPMVNSTDSVRAMLGSNMADQSLPVEGANRPLIYTGTNAVKPDGPKSPISGVVTEVTDNYVEITNKKTGDKEIIRCPVTRTSSYHTATMYKPTYKKGQAVSIGDTVYRPSAFIGDELCLGRDANVAYVHTGYDYEDGIILRRGFADNFTHMRDTELRFEFERYNVLFDKAEVFSGTKEADLKNLDDIGFIKVGSKVHAGDILFGYNKVIHKGNVAEVVRDLLDKRTNSKVMRTQYIERVPNSIKEGVVESIVLYDPYGKAPDGLKKYDFRLLNQQSKINIYEDLSGSLDESSDYAVIIKVKYPNIVKVGDKFTNEWGSKGIVVKIYDDKEMYRIGAPDGEPVDVIMSPVSTLNRKGLSQLKQGFLGKCSRKLWKEVHDGLVESALMPSSRQLTIWKNKIALLTQSDYVKTLPLEDFIKFVKSTEDIGGFRIQMHCIETRFTMEKLKEISEAIKVPIDCKVDMYKDGKKLDQPVVVTYGRVNRLHFIPEEKMSATTDNKHVKESVLGGKCRNEGQLIGEMEMWALSSYGHWNYSDVLTTENTNQGEKLLIEMLILGKGIVQM